MVSTFTTLKLKMTYLVIALIKVVILPSIKLQMTPPFLMSTSRYSKKPSTPMGPHWMISHISFFGLPKPSILSKLGLMFSQSLLRAISAQIVRVAL